VTVTHVGIVEWSRRTRGAAALHRAVADALGRCIGGAAIGARYSLLDRARRHGWCADEWTTVVPLLHDVDATSRLPLDPAVDQALADLGRDPDGTVALEAEGEVVVQLGHLYTAWRATTTPFADAPYVAVLDRVVRELTASEAG
jgi:hypothetical protein